MTESATAPRYRYLRFLAVLACVYLAANLIPLIFHRSVDVGDNLIQNNPLRYLSAEILKSGHLPAWNIFSWSGTPLMAGFNAGTYYPLSALYLILPPLVALGVFIAGVQLIFAAGLFWLMENLKIGEVPGAIMAGAAPFLGYFAAQTLHLDMIGGIAMVPFMLIALIHLTRAATFRQAFGAGMLLGVSYSLVILAGAPEAMIYGATFVAVFGILELIRSRTSIARIIPFGAAFLMTVLLLSAVQLLPGLAYVALSQRSHPSVSFVTFGPLYPNAFMSLVTPFLFGGPVPNSGQPGYFGAFGYEEMQLYVGILPLVLAAFALIEVVFASRRNRRQPTTPLSSRRILQDLVFATIFSTIAALGSLTPVESLLLHVPIYDKQRLPARNIFALQITLLVLAASGLERFLATLRRSRTILTASGALAVIAVIQSTLIASIGTAFTIWLGGTYHQINDLREIIASSAVELAIIVAFAAIAFLRPHFTRLGVLFAVVALIGVDIVSYSYQSYYGSPVQTSIATGKDPQQIYLSALLHRTGGRYAIYDPNVSYFSADNSAGAPNLSIFDQTSSMMGYSSLSLGTYEAATASHQRTTMDPALFYSELGKELELNVAIAGQGFFSTMQPVGSAVPQIPQPFAPLSLSSAGTQGSTMSVSDYLGRTVTATRILLGFGVQSNSTVANSPAIGIDSLHALGVRLSGSESVVWARPTGKVILHPTSGITLYAYDLPAATTFDQIVATQTIPANIPNPQRAIVAGVSIEGANFNLSLDGSLVGYLTPQVWQYASTQGPLAYFTRRSPDPLALRFASQSPWPPVPIGLHSQITVASASVTVAGKIQYRIDAQSPANMIISEAYAPGWESRVSSSNGTSVSAARACGVFVCLDVPRGVSLVTLTYVAPRSQLGLALSGLGLVWLGGAIFWIRRRPLRASGH